MIYKIKQIKLKTNTAYLEGGREVKVWLTPASLYKGFRQLTQVS